jgi:polyhydroxybutyrate depolymerase
MTRSAAAGWLVAMGLTVTSIAMEGIAQPPTPPAAEAALGTLPLEPIVVNGLRRVARFYVPPHLSRQPALVIALHGSGGDGNRFRRLTRGAFDRLADEHGFIVAYPDAIGGQWHDCRAQAPYQAALAGVDDVAFIRAIVRRGAARAGGDIAGAFVVGYSNGGHLVFRLAWEAPGEFTAFAAIGAHLPVAGERGCAASGSPVSMFLVSGSEDPINPWTGGVVQVRGGTFGHVLSGEATAAYFRDLAGLRNSRAIEWRTDRDKLDETTVETHVWAAAGRPEVVWMIVRGGGHSLPLPDGAFPTDVVGRTSRDLNGAEAIWNFFARGLRRPAEGPARR